MSQIDETFFTTVGCMDGRVQAAVAAYGKEHFSATFPDTITEAGIVGILSKEVDDSMNDSLLFKIVSVSLEKHRSKGIVVHGHEECAGNPVDDIKHKEDIRQSVQYITKLVKNAVPVKGVFVKRSTESPSVWQVIEVI